MKLPHLDDWNRRRRSVAERYAAALDDLPVDLPLEPPGRSSSWHLYVIGTDRRDDLATHLGEAGIGTVVHSSIPPHRQGAYAGLGTADLPVADRLADRSLSLPIGPHLTADQVDHVVSSMRTFPW